MAKTIKLKNDVLRMSDRKKTVTIEGGVLDGAVLSIRPPSGLEKRKTLDLQIAQQWAESQLYQMSVCIVEWNLADEQGEPLPITDELLSQIDDEVFTTLWEKVQPFVEDRTAEETRFLPGSAENSQQEKPSAPNDSQNIQT